MSEYRDEANSKVNFSDPYTIKFDFDAYLLIDNLAIDPSDEDIFTAFGLNSADVIHKRCFYYREHFHRKRCAVVKYISQETAVKEQQRHEYKIVYGNRVNISHLKILNDFQDAEKLLIETHPKLEVMHETLVFVLNVDDTIDGSLNASTRAKNMLSQFGPVSINHNLGTLHGTSGNFMASYQHFISAMAAQLALNKTLVNGREITVTFQRNKTDLIDQICAMFFTYHKEEQLGMRATSVFRLEALDLSTQEEITDIVADSIAELRLAQEESAPLYDEIWSIKGDDRLISAVKKSGQMTGKLISDSVSKLSKSPDTVIKEEDSEEFLCNGRSYCKELFTTREKFLRGQSGLETEQETPAAHMDRETKQKEPSESLTVETGLAMGHEKSSTDLAAELIRRTKQSALTMGLMQAAARIEGNNARLKVLSERLNVLSDRQAARESEFYAAASSRSE